jgi:hypothetical protein
VAGFGERGFLKGEIGKIFFMAQNSLSTGFRSLLHKRCNFVVVFSTQNE